MKKFILLFILILIGLALLSVIGLCVYRTNFEVIEMKEMSLLYQPFKIESTLVQVVMGDESTTPESDNDEANSSNNSGSGKSRKRNNAGSYDGYGTESFSGTVSYTPKIQIPRTGIKYTIFDSETTRNMERGVAILYTDNGLNQPGNTVITGHNRGNGRFFSRNNRIQIGDVINITDETGETISYIVYANYVTDPTDASFFDRDTEGDREITLITCTNDGANRIVIWASEP